MSTNRFYLLQQQKLQIEFEKISLLTRHGPTMGAYREALLRNHVRSLVPSSLKVTSGFVASNLNGDDLREGQSRQIDILVYDSDRYVPLIETDGFSVVLPESIRACIEVKSSLTFYKSERSDKSAETNDEFPLGSGFGAAYRWAGTLVDSLQNIKDAADTCHARCDAYFSGILAFESTFDPLRLYEALDGGELQVQLGISHLRQLPAVICVLGKTVTTFSESDFQETGAGYEDDYTSFYNEIRAVAGNEQLPFQFFSVFMTNQIGYLHSKREANSNGMNSCSGQVRIFSHHFDLASGL